LRHYEIEDSGFVKWFTRFLHERENKFAWSHFIRWLTSDHYVSIATHTVAARIIQAAVFAYRAAIIFIFAFMLIHVALFFRKNKNLRVSAVLFATTIFFFATQFHVPIINYKQNNDYFSESEWRQELLENLNEPSLFRRNATDNETIYRIINTGRSSSRAVRVHLNRAERTGVLHFTFFVTDTENRTLNEDGFNEPIREEQTFELNSAQYRQVKRLFSRHKFWRTPSSVKYAGFDGYTFIIEGQKNGKYHMVERWCPAYCNMAYLGDALFRYAFLLLYESWDDEGRYAIMG